MLGSHLSAAGGVVNALVRAAELDMDCVQVFTRNQRQWRAPPLRDDMIDAWKSQLIEMGWSEGDRVVSHNSYLVNLASPDRAARDKSMALQRDEMERCESLHIPLLVAHPGARLGTPRPRGEANILGGDPTREELAGLGRIAKSMDRLHRDLPGYRVVTCLETTVGSGTNLGYDFGHLAAIRDMVQDPERVAFCFDTCHVTAAGYDMSSAQAAAAVLNTFEELCGMSQMRVIHLNDSIGECGSRTDRHAHIGEGTCGRSCFSALLKHPALEGVPMILETAKEDDPRGRPMDSINTSRLRKIAKSRR